MLNEPSYAWLIAHLVEAEDQWQDLVNDYVPANPANDHERRELCSFFENYIATLNELITSGQAANLDPQDLPYVIIGSEVELVDVRDLATYNYRISYPLQSQQNSISCISPVGQALLLRPKGETVLVAAPGGVYSYLVKSIKLG